MKTYIFKNLLGIMLILFCFAINLSAQNQSPIVKEIDIRIGPRGEKTIEVNVPEGAKKISATLSNQSEMINLKILGPTNVVLCKTTTWSYLSNWEAPLKCNVGIVNNERQKAGIWRIKIEGAVHKSNIKSVKHVSAKLEIKIEGTFQDQSSSSEDNSIFPITKEFDFTIGSRSEKIFEVNIPEGAKQIYAIISDQSEMINLKILGPTNVELCKTTTWSYLPNWKAPLKCHVGIVNNERQKAGIWRIKIEGAVHKGKIKQVKNVSGKLVLKITDD